MRTGLSSITCERPLNRKIVDNIDTMYLLKVLDISSVENVSKHDDVYRIVFHYYQDVDKLEHWLTQKLYSKFQVNPFIIVYDKVDNNEQCLQIDIILLEPVQYPGLNDLIQAITDVAFMVYIYLDPVYVRNSVFPVNKGRAYYCNFTHKMYPVAEEEFDDFIHNVIAMPISETDITVFNGRDTSISEYAGYEAFGVFNDILYMNNNLKASIVNKEPNENEVFNICSQSLLLPT